MALKSPYGELSLESIFFNIIPLQPLQLNYKIIYKLIKKMYIISIIKVIHGRVLIKH